MENVPRKPWVAATLTLIQPGLGHVYNGELSKGLLIYLLPFLLIPSSLICLHSQHLRTVFTLFSLLAFIIYTAVLVDVVRTARKLRDHYTPRKYNKTVIYIAIFASSFVLNNAMSYVVKNTVIKAFRFPSDSMEPTLLKGDHILVDRTNAGKHPHRGEVIVFEFPEDPAKDFLKRVVAVGGDTVAVRNKILYVNGKAMTEPYVVHQESDMIPARENPRDNFGPEVIPAGSFFVMGDNRDKSFDSRFFGPVTSDKVKGTVRTVYWSWDQKKSAVRWDRVGMNVL